MMPVLNPLFFTCWRRGFPKFSVYLLSSNPRFTFHTCSSLNFRKNNKGNLEKINKHVVTPIHPQHFGKIIALDPEKADGCYEETDLPIKKKGKNRLDKASREGNEIGIKNTKTLKREEKSANHTGNDNAEEEEKIELKFKYKQLKNNFPIGGLMPNLKNRKLREKNKEILLEGKRIINEALSARLKAKMIFFSRASDVKDLELSEDVKVYKTAYKELQLWSCNTTCPGIMGVFKLPEQKIIHENNSLLPVTVICDNVREPGNLGAILRVAVGVGCKKIILTKGCVDLWDPKVLRSGCGAHFRASLLANAEWSDIEKEISEVEEVLIGDNRFPLINRKENNDDSVDSNDSFEVNVPSGQNLPTEDYTSLDYKKHDGIVCILGGETHGISKSAYQFAVKRNGKRIFIPISNDIESLNSAVALGIMLYEIRRQRIDMSSGDLKKKSSDCEFFEEAVVTAP